ncbi:hypothetical protein FOXYS1_5086 [Fusarium oxysporum]|uniref:Uncharacterized protein n=1 Tax=Fusarium oxysporum TaxID=5507 RepID=A0A8H5EKS8_FUSOX|nr:hypothetical protein FOXYS1_5086 [Fusarium oxysporum]
MERLAVDRRVEEERRTAEALLAFEAQVAAEERQGLEKSMFSPIRSVNTEPYQPRLEALLDTSSSTVPDDDSEIDGQYEERDAIEHGEDPRRDYNSRTYLWKLGSENESLV